MPLFHRAVLACLLLGLTDASGIVVSLGASADKISAPKESESADHLNSFLESRANPTPPFPYWNHVGTVGMGTGVYLGDGFVLTSAHVGCNPFEMSDGSAYQPQYDSWQVLSHPQGMKSDVAVFKLRPRKSGNAFPPLGSLPVAATTPAEKLPVVMIGSGYIQNPKPNTISSNGKILANLGYRIDLVRRTLWGVNEISEIIPTPVKTNRQYHTDCFATSFERAAHEGQATDGDSGGAIFSFNEKLRRWELTGCILAVSQDNFVVPYGSRTFLANLATYQDQLPAQAPGPALLASKMGDPAPSALPLAMPAEGSSIGENLPLPPSGDTAPGKAPLTAATEEFAQD